MMPGDQGHLVLDHFVMDKPVRESLLSAGVQGPLVLDHFIEGEAEALSRGAEVHMAGWRACYCSVSMDLPKTRSSCSIARTSATGLCCFLQARTNAQQRGSGHLFDSCKIKLSTANP